jgi:membrane-bound lytic murein transglycosylase A
MNMHTMEAYLRGLPLADMRRMLEHDPRYVFFRPRVGPGPSTSFGVPATDGRTVATDRARPKGTLALINTTQPRFADARSLTPVRWDPLERFVLDEDTGSGIVGARVDLYWGRGAEARRSAGVMQQPGRLYYLVPR